MDFYYCLEEGSKDGGEEKAEAGCCQGGRSMFTLGFGVSVVLGIGRLGDRVWAGHADGEEEDDHEGNGDGHGVHVDECWEFF